MSIPTTPGNNPIRTGDGWWLRKRALMLVLAAATALAFYLCFLMAAPFLTALSWALALAVVVSPLHAWLRRRTGSDTLSALASILVVIVVLIVPLGFVVSQVVPQASAGAAQVQTQTENGRWRETIRSVPQLAPALDWLDQRVDLEAEVRRAIAAIVGDLSTLLTGSLWAVLQILISLFTLFYFLRDRWLILGNLRRLLPLSHTEIDGLYERVADTIHATIYGQLFVAALQGTLAGLIFWLLDLPSPVMWGLVMSVIAVVPCAGTFVVWVPAAVFLALEGSWGKALILAGWGATAVALIDNGLYPILVGKRLRLHPVPVFFAIVGGLFVFGASGVIVGPVVLSITDALINVWRQRTADGRPAEAALACRTSCTVATAPDGNGAAGMGSRTAGQGVAQ